MKLSLLLRPIAAAVLLLSAISALADDRDEDRTGQWHLSVYSGKAGTDRLLDIITKFDTPFIDSYLVSVAPAWTLSIIFLAMPGGALERSATRSGLSRSWMKS